MVPGNAKSDQNVTVGQAYTGGKSPMAPTWSVTDQNVLDDSDVWVGFE